MSVVAGTEYSYQVSAFNIKGGVTSLAAFTMTYSSSPDGLNPPILLALSSTSVRASWTQPLSPNGIIVNFTLYSNSSNIVFSGLQLDTVVLGLSPWTNYSFSVQACTAAGCRISGVSQVATLPASPVGQSAPKVTALSDSRGVMAGVLVEWNPPSRSNGIIVRYEVYRRNESASLAGK